MLKISGFYCHVSDYSQRVKNVQNRKVICNLLYGNK